MATFKSLRSFLCLFVMLILPASTLAASAIHSAAFYYGANPPVEALHQFNVVVVNPGSSLDPTSFDTKDSQAYAHVNLGEVTNDASYVGDVDKSWVLGQDPISGSNIMDQTNPHWQDFVMHKLITPLWEKGYHAFFIDNLDSYQMVSLPLAKKAQQQGGLVRIIKAIRAKYPSAKIIVNQGFSILPQIDDRIDGIVAEGLFQTWDPKTKVYGKTPALKHLQLLSKLDNAKFYNLPIIVVDYVSADEKAKAVSTAKRIQDLGFIPYITDHGLETVGISATRPPKPKIPLKQAKSAAHPQYVHYSMMDMFDELIRVLL